MLINNPLISGDTNIANHGHIYLFNAMQPYVFIRYSCKYYLDYIFTSYVYSSLFFQFPTQLLMLTLTV